MKYRDHYCMPKYSDGDRCYYGSVEGVPEIPMIEAGSIDDFERLFHQAVDDYLDGRRAAGKKAGRGWLVAVLALIGILIAMALTCPKKDQHVDAVLEKISYLISDTAGAENDSQVLGAMLGNAIAKPLVKTYLTVDDYVLFSVGHFVYNGEESTASLGVFGHVFTVTRKELKRRLEQDGDAQEFLNNLFK